MSQAPSIAEWIATTCGGLSKPEERTMLSMGVKVEVHKNASTQEKQLYEQLKKRSFDAYSCGLDKITNARHVIKEIAN
jgi:hypothetical protein